MEKRQILDRLRALIRSHLDGQHAASVADMQDDTHLFNEYSLDSVDSVELCMHIEKAFDIIIEDEELEQVETVDDLITLISGKR
jgi:acyl carrier protein